LCRLSASAATRDAIYHLDLAIGDLSPRYLDEGYAKNTRWGSLIAPPIIVNSMDTLRAVGSASLPERLPGVHSIWTGSLYEWERPVKAGHRIHSKSYLKEIGSASRAATSSRCICRSCQRPSSRTLRASGSVRSGCRSRNSSAPTRSASGSRTRRPEPS
jgi:acyl dehydratase